MCLVLKLDTAEVNNPRILCTDNFKGHIGWISKGTWVYNCYIFGGAHRVSGEPEMEFSDNSNHFEKIISESIDNSESWTLEILHIGAHWKSIYRCSLGILRSFIQNKWKIYRPWDEDLLINLYSTPELQESGSTITFLTNFAPWTGGFLVENRRSQKAWSSLFGCVFGFSRKFGRDINLSTRRVFSKGPKPDPRIWALTSVRTLQRGPTFWGTFSVFFQLKSACSDGLLSKNGMHISLASEWLLESEDPCSRGANCPAVSMSAVRIYIGKFWQGNQWIPLVQCWYYTEKSSFFESNTTMKHIIMFLLIILMRVLEWSRGAGGAAVATWGECQRPRRSRRGGGGGGGEEGVGSEESGEIPFVWIIGKNQTYFDKKFEDKIVF